MSEILAHTDFDNLNQEGVITDIMYKVYDEEIIESGTYLCLIQPTGWPIWSVLDRVRGKWMYNDAVSKDDQIKAYIKLPDEGLSINYINEL